MVNPPGEAQENIAHNDKGWNDSLFTLFEIATKITYENDPKEKKIDRKEYERIWKAMSDCEDEGALLGFKDSLYGASGKLTRDEFIDAMNTNSKCNWVLDAELIRKRYQAWKSDKTALEAFEDN
jgi:hypothetical protein